MILSEEIKQGQQLDMIDQLLKILFHPYVYDDFLLFYLQLN